MERCVGAFVNQKPYFPLSVDYLPANVWVRVFEGGAPNWTSRSTTTTTRNKKMFCKFQEKNRLSKKCEARKIISASKIVLARKLGF